MNGFVRIVFHFCCAAFLECCIFGESVKSGNNDTSHAGMNPIPAKDHSFQMGEAGLAEPVHRVSFIYDFYMDTTEVTQADYQSLMGVNPSYFGGTLTRPVERITWLDAVLYCNRRSQRDSLDTVYGYSGISGTPGNGVDTLADLTIDYSKNGYRLPTEAEWEYACRGGSQTAFYWGDQEDSTAAYGWYSDNSSDSTQPVASKKPNAFGLYDMAGNVYEWIGDWYADYDSAAQIDPHGADTGSFHALRSGCWFNTPLILHAAYRGKEPAIDRNLDVGFRCVKPR